MVKEVRAQKLAVEDQITAARNRHTKERLAYLAAVERALSRRKSATAERVASAWDDLTAAWTELDEIHKALAASGKYYPSAHTQVATIRRLIGGIIDKNIGGVV